MVANLFVYEETKSLKSASLTETLMLNEFGCYRSTPGVRKITD